MTLSLITALRDIDAFAGHLDTRDPRPVATIGRLDLTNLRLGMKHLLALHRLLRGAPGADAHLPLSQGTWGFLRDAALIGLVRAHRRRVYIQLHGSHLQAFVHGAPPPMRALIRVVLGAVHQAWALTPSLMGQFDGLVPDGRVTYVENVVDDAFGTAAHGRKNNGRAIRVLFLSNLLPDKGVDDLISALRNVWGESRHWEVRLVGEVTSGEERRLLAAIARLPDGSGSVRLLGPQYGRDKRAQYAWADLFVFPARQDEGQPLVLLEAMSAGNVIVATRQPGIEDTLTNGVEGLLVPRSDPLALARTLTRLAHDPALRCELGEAARRRYERSYRTEDLAHQLMRVLSDSHER
jgi:glycosyltransferase involved in cell wall biosynthesis